MNFILKHKLMIVGVIAGAIAGYLYYYFIGCESGTCAITSRPFNSTLYGAVMGGLLFNMRKNKKDMNIQKIIKENQGTVVDVRTTEEFRRGNVSGSINIPLQEIGKRMDEVKKLKQPLILCCASGGRSGQANGYLAQQGIECLNGGSWMDLRDYQTKG